MLSAEEPAGKKTKTIEIPGHVTEVMSSNPVILETVFSHLSPRDIKAVALVSPAWREVVDQPRFWSWAVMRLGGTSGRRWRAGGSP